MLQWYVCFPIFQIKSGVNFIRINLVEIKVDPWLDLDIKCEPGAQN